MAFAINSILMNDPGLKRESGSTLPELMITALVLAVFFSGIFEVSGICLRYISSAKENINAVECVHDRIEQLRNLDFASLTNASTVATALAVPPNSSGLGSIGTETVTISAFTGTSATTPKVTFVRPPGASLGTSPAPNVPVTPTTTWTGGSAFSAATIANGAVQVDVTYSWNAVLGQRTRSESSSTLISSGTKK